MAVSARMVMRPRLRLGWLAMAAPHAVDPQRGCFLFVQQREFQTLFFARGQRKRCASAPPWQFKALLERELRAIRSLSALLLYQYSLPIGSHHGRSGSLSQDEIDAAAWRR